MSKDAKWIIAPEADPEKVNALSLALGIDRVLAGLLVQRGIETFEQARSFFRPSLEDLHDPFLMKDMTEAVERLHKAISSGEKILVYGDYDVDGTTAVALVYSFIKRYSDSVDFYIPDRYDEGYGLSIKGIETAEKGGYTLIITLDCGIKAIQKVQLAKDKGIDVIVCDHHLPEDELPHAVAVLDPKREDDSYPFNDLCGCGVGFKLVQGYSQKYGIPFDTLEPLLDLCAVSIASDLVLMTGENRILAHYGLKTLNENPRNGFKALMNLSNLEPGHVGIDDIVFKLGPRINAAGRMESGRLAVELLTAEEQGQAMIIAQRINENNNNRKNIDREITAEALDMVENGAALASENATIVYNPKWNKGVVGIVASRLVEAFYKPTVVLTRSNGFITGSARSVQGFDLYSAIESCADLLVNFGGHMYAAGLTLREEDLPEFARRMDEFVKDKLSEEQTVPNVDIDARLGFENITPKFSRILKQVQPFGPGTTNPVFLTENVYDSGNGRKVGAGGVHLKLDLILDSQPYHRIPAIGFNMSEYYDYIREGNAMDVCYSIVENYSKGSSSLQLRLRDIRKRNDLDL